ncbi:MAG: TlpA family protein disulfide reductase [Actinobacteria bacterium]|nr:TlpA family protein disulfide reductase [Actinomycetota bacterium]
MSPSSVLRSRAVWVILPLVAVVVAALLAGGDSQPTDPTETRIIPAAQREPAPDRAAPLLMEQGDLSLTEYRGRVVVLNFWASWCGPCRREQPELNDAAARLEDGDVAFLGVAVNDPEANARAHWQEFAVPYPSVVDRDASYAAAFGGISPAALPTTLIIDDQGRVAARIFGETDADEVTQLVGRILGE